jgi:hypothetical protein
LKEGMGQDVKNARGECAPTPQRQEHVSQLADRGISEYPFDVILHEADRCREDQP